MLNFFLKKARGKAGIDRKILLGQKGRLGTLLISEFS